MQGTVAAVTARLSAAVAELEVVPVFDIAAIRGGFQHCSSGRPRPLGLVFCYCHGVADEDDA